MNIQKLHLDRGSQSITSIEHKRGFRIFWGSTQLEMNCAQRIAYLKMWLDFLSYCKLKAKRDACRRVVWPCKEFEIKIIYDMNILESYINNWCATSDSNFFI